MAVEATGWPDIQILETNCNFAIIPHSGRAKLFSAKAAQWPFYQRQAQWPFYQWASYLQQKKLAQWLFYQREAQWPFYQRQAQWPFYQGRDNGWPDLQISAANGNFAIIRTINLSAAGRSYFQQKQAQWPCYQRQVQWPFYQRQAQWPFYQGRSNRMARPPDFSNNLQFRYYPAQSIYQRPGQAILKQKPAQLQFYQHQTQWPF